MAWEHYASRSQRLRGARCVSWRRPPMPADLASTLAKLQADLGISQAGLAHLLGVRRQTLAQWLAGGRAVWADPWPDIRRTQALLAIAQGGAEEARRWLEAARAKWPKRGKWARAGTPSPGSEP